MRLDKYLSDAGIGTRSQVKKMIAAGRVHVNGAAARQASMQLDERTADVTADGKKVRYARFEYYMLNKPQGVISASRISAGTAEDGAGEICVVDLITDRIRDDLFPVGRLDRDTEGLLLITNDGQLAHALLSPHRHVDKTYFVRTGAPLREEERERLERGIDIGDEKITLPCRITRIVKTGPGASEEISGAPYVGGKDLSGKFTAGDDEDHSGESGVGGGDRTGVSRPEIGIVTDVSRPEIGTATDVSLPGNGTDAGTFRHESQMAPDESRPGSGDGLGSSCLITIREGRYHQIKRMFAAVGLTVTYLKRLSMGSLTLDPALAPGEYRPLTEDEVRLLKETVGGAQSSPAGGSP